MHAVVLNYINMCYHFNKTLIIKRVRYTDQSMYLLQQQTKNKWTSPVTSVTLQI